MTFGALLILAYGPLNWTFPWWVWALGIVGGLASNAARARMAAKD